MFWRKDDTGRVAIEPEGTDVTPRYKDVWRSRASLAGFASKPAHTVNFLTNHASGNRYRFTEERINLGDELYAIGLLKNLGSHLDTTTIDAEVRQLLHEWKKDQATLKQRFDLNNDGKIDQMEWKLAHSQARREVAKARREQSEFFTEGINLLTRPNGRNRPFLLSAFPQRDLIKRYCLWALRYSAGFFAFSSAGIWLFNTRFG